MALKFRGALALKDSTPVEAAKSPYKSEIEAEQIELPLNTEKGCNGQIGSLANLQRSINKQRAKNELFKRIMQEYQTNIKISESLRAEILKGQQAGESTETLLLKAAKCISLMTGDSVFYSQIKKHIS